jgi:hypothetical protein
VDRKPNNLFSKAAVEKFSYHFPFGARYPGTEIGIHGKDQLEKPPCQISDRESFAFILKHIKEN